VTLRRPPSDDLVVDTSAIVALLLGEPEAAAIATALASAASPIMSAATVVELGIVAEARSGKRGGSHVRALLDAATVDVIPVDHLAASRAIDSWRRFGKGRHRAALNFGDCFSHSLAVHAQLPILCVGDDFTHTDATVVDLSLFA
jgi:ribonuclease VapC